MADLQIQSIPYSEDSSLLMARLLDLPFPIFLDSCNHNPQGGRYDFLTASPLATLEIENGVFTCSEPLPAGKSGDVFATAQQLLQRHSPESSGRSQVKVPFDGGLLGFLGYPRLTGPGRIAAEQGFLGVYPWVLVVDHLERRSRLIWQPNCPQETRHAVLKRLQCNEEIAINFELISDFSKDLSEQQYSQSFQRISDYIEAGDCYQVNLTQRFSSRFDGHPFAAYRRLRRTTGKPFSSYFGWRDQALLCLSPERFIQVENQHVTTQPIKGTRPRSAVPAEDQRLAAELVGSEKDRAENLMIVDLLRNDLGTVCQPGSIQATRLFELQRFDNVFHLVSTICGMLPEDLSPLELFRNCYPGGSVTGAPKVRAMEIIEELEAHRREVYCGNVFYLGFNGCMDSNITIRSLYCRQQNIFCWAGGGIVADSTCEQEYRECFDKINSLINSLQG